jgi:hypothetical protein
MARADSANAIGAVTRLLRDHLIRASFEVSVGRPEEAAKNDANAKLNLFLYETVFDPHLRNVTLRDGEPPPLWLVVKYLLTAFDDKENSDSEAAHELLGRGMAVLQQLNFLRLDPLVAPAVRRALEDNPEPLKLTFDDANVELMSRIMQGTDERYRLSVAFQVRPVMIVPATLPRGAQLVGVDYLTSPETIIGRDGVQVDVVPSLGARLERVEPDRFEAGTTVTLFGADLGAATMEAVLGGVTLRTVERHADRLVVVAEGDPGTPIADGAAVSAGELPLVARRRLGDHRTRSSNLLAARLLPTLTGAVLAGGVLTLSGILRGGADDDVMVLLIRAADGSTAHLFDKVVASADQKSLTIAGVAAALAPGTYRVLLRVNNQQAKASPAVTV